MKRRWKETLEGYLFLLPALIVLSIFVFWPIGFSLVLSFFKWDFRNMKNPSFIGLGNYREIFKFSSPTSYPFWMAVVYTLVFLALSLALVLMIARTMEKDRRWFIHALYFLIFVLLFIAGYITNTYVAAIMLLFFVFIFLELRDLGNKLFKHLWLVLFAILGIFIVLRYVFPVDYGILNYVLEAKEKNLFIKAIYNTTYYVILTVPTTIFLALMIALLLNANIKLRAFFRTAYFLPFVTSIVAISLVWQWIYNDEYGLLNYVLSWFGIEKIAWLKDEKWTIPTIAILSIWKGVGYDAVIFLAGLQNIDKFYYEAADVDGANTFQKFLYITWPLLSPTTFFLLIVSMINAFKVFAEVYVLYGGLPGPYNYSGLTMVYYVFDLFYRQQRMGIACAGAYLLFIIIAVLTFIQFKIGRKMVEYAS
ncbi:MAG: ABC transporter permease subunit [Thermotogaceae bacterium]|nr:ABC transporter permease subunit [Thermotogaceae bacterium]